jgi:hypothetical protein
MQATAAQIFSIFEKKVRLEVPLFQRQYVWSQEKQWEPLWEDISRKYTEYIEGRTDAPVHFLGAMVLDQKQTPITHVERRQVIDGQQRLTTFQIFLDAFRDYCTKSGINEYADECNAFIKNPGKLPNPEVDIYKIWPTQSDVSQFIDVISSGSFDSLLDKYPLVYRKRSKTPQPRPRMVEAYFFFYESLSKFFNEKIDKSAGNGDEVLLGLVEICFMAMTNSLYVVVIDLDTKDDAQDTECKR